MFFKMLQSDLKKNKGLNVILFVFVIVAATLTVVGALQSYLYLYGVPYTMEQCQSSDVLSFYRFSIGEREQEKAKLNNYLKSRQDVERFCDIEGPILIGSDIEIPEFAYEEREVLSYGTKILTKQPRELDLLYDTEDRPFFVENGTIAVSTTFQDRTNTKIGDKLQIATQMGNIYEFTISHFYKVPTNMGIDLFVVSDADYEVFAKECPLIADAYRLKLMDPEKANEFVKNYPQDEEAGLRFISYHNLFQDNYQAIMAIVSYAVLGIDVFVIVIMMLTIRFMMIASVKEAEKEIGMMIAIGVDSLRYRWCFIAKYIAFALVGGFLGGVFGILISKVQISLFCKNTILPTRGMRIVLSLLAVSLVIFCIIGFSMLTVRRIRKISVIDVIHGENRGERFGKASKFVLYLRKKMKVPFFLALSDLLNSCKRYLVLIITYSLGMAVILAVCFLESTFNSPKYDEYFMYNRKVDFEIHFDSDTYQKYFQREGSYEGLLKAVSRELEEAGIPANISYDHVSYGNILLDTQKISCEIMFGDVDPHRFTFRKGGSVPKLDNEIALTYKCAKLNNLHIGDKITLEFYEYGEDRTQSHKTTKEFLITAFIDVMEVEAPTVLLSGDNDSMRKDTDYVVFSELEGNKKEKEQYLRQMKEMYGEDQIRSYEEYSQAYFGNMLDIIDTLKLVMGGLVILVMVLVTTLYSSVLLHEEMSSIAGLKCMGFSNRDIRKWQMYRMGLIVLGSVVIGNVLAQTVIERLVALVFELQFQFTGFQFVISPWEAYLIIPLLGFFVIMLTMTLRLKSVDKIQIWKIREE